MSNTKKKAGSCIWCARGLTKICRHKIKQATHLIISDSDTEEEETPAHRTYKTDAALKDQQSTGRKRAAQLYPLFRESLCEWAALEKAGGGNHPIRGCAIREDSTPGLQKHRHHGPDKNTLNNEEGNVHRICTGCHNLWHAQNDGDYIAGSIIEED